MYQKKSFLNSFLIICLIFNIYELVLCIDQSLCGDWETFKDEKCFKIFSKEDLQTYENALKSCSQLEKVSTRLLTISSKEEQDFVSDFIFNKNKIKEDVWLGGKRVNSSSFKWSDNSDVKYTNWAENKPTKELNRDCIEMKSEFDFYSYDSSKGKWTDTPCDKKGVVVCQKLQNWSISVLQNQLLKAEKKLEDLAKLFVESNIALGNEIKNMIPIGFVYTQLPHNKPPQEIWPQMKWNDISGQYKDLFFRVVGDKSESFGKIQEENAPILTKVEANTSYWIKNEVDKQKAKWDTSFPKNGWSDWVFTGSWVVLSDPTATFTRFFNSGGEIHPKNIAIKVWQRIN